MAAVTSTASDLIVGALRNLNVLAAGEPLNSNDSADALQVLNDLIESLSTEKLFIFTPNNYTLAWTPGQYTYTIGNPTQGTFTGYTVSGSPLIYGITNLGSLNITFGLNGNGVQVGGTLTDVQNAIPSGATIVSANFGTTTNITFTAPPTGNTATVSGWAGGAVSGLLTFSDNETRPASISALGAAAWSVALTGTPTASGNQINTNTITMSANATQTLSAADSITYTAPGNFAIPRPLRIRPGFTRITSSGSTSGLDYWYDVTSFDDYVEIGYKGQPGPWPDLVAYQPSYPYGTLLVYPNPQTAGQVFLFTDLILSDFTSLTQAVSLPQGYARAIKKLLALELAPEYGKQPTMELMRQAKEARDFIKNLNAAPVKKMRYDSAIVAGDGKDAGWIYRGGFR